MFITEDTNVKQTKVTTTYNQDLIKKYLQKILKRPNGKAWVLDIEIQQ
jgi:hypothetical protein